MGLERVIETWAGKHVKRRGGGMKKFVSPGHRGVPDDALAHPNCGPWLMEFKAPTKRSEKHQIDMQQELANEGWTVFRDVDTIKLAREIIDDMIDEPNRAHWRHKPVAPDVLDDGFGD